MIERGNLTNKKGIERRRGPGLPSGARRPERHVPSVPVPKDLPLTEIIRRIDGGRDVDGGRSYAPSPEPLRPELPEDDRPRPEIPLDEIIDSKI